MNKGEQISAMLSERIAAGDFPSAQYAVGVGGRVVLSDALGDAVITPEKLLATTETIYDAASLTKPLVTGLLCARKVERGELELDESVAEYLPEFATDDKRAITIRQLLTHTSGLPAWRPLYLLTDNPTHALRVIAGEKLLSAPGTHVLYSDLGFIALGLLLERIAGDKLALIARREIFEPLALRRTFFNPPASLQEEIAASETGNAYEQWMCREHEEAQHFRGWREEVIRGEVHDGNAHFLGGAAGHAGLFSTARETLRLAEQFIAGRTQLLAPETCDLFRQNMTAGMEEARSFAWQLAMTKDSTAGTHLPPDSFGHLGFTGTSCWTDAAHQRSYILFTNRTHARRSLPFANINGVRRLFHTLAADALERTA